MEQNNRKNRRRKVILPILTVVILAFAACGIYLSDYYRADMEAMNAFVTENPVEMRSDAEGNLVFEMAYGATVAQNAEGGLDVTVNYGQMGEKVFTMTAEQAKAVLG